jgi:hypothetical protein
MNPSEKFLLKLGLSESDSLHQPKAGEQSEENSRRSFFKKSALGGLALGSSFMFSPLRM